MNKPKSLKAIVLSMALTAGMLSSANATAQEAARRGGLFGRGSFFDESVGLFADNDDQGEENRTVFGFDISTGLFGGNGGLFGKGAETEAGASNGSFMRASGANSFDITTGLFGGNGGQAGGNYGISIGTIGQEPPAPLGSGLFIMAAAGAAYAFSKKRKKQENN